MTSNHCIAMFLHLAINTRARGCSLHHRQHGASSISGGEIPLFVLLHSSSPLFSLSLFLSLFLSFPLSLPPSLSLPIPLPLPPISLSLYLCVPYTVYSCVRTTVFHY